MASTASNGVAGLPSINGVNEVDTNLVVLPDGSILVFEEFPNCVLTTDSTGTVVGVAEIANTQVPTTLRATTFPSITTTTDANIGGSMLAGGSSRVRGATTVAANFTIDCTAADYGRLSFGTPGANGFYIEQNGTALRFIRGQFGGTPVTIATMTNANSWNFNANASASQTFYIASAGQLEVQRSSAGIRWRQGGTGSTLSLNVNMPAANRIATIPALAADDTFLFVNASQSPTFNSATVGTLSCSNYDAGIAAFNGQITASSVITGSGVVITTPGAFLQWEDALGNTSFEVYPTAGGGAVWQFPLLGTGQTAIVVYTDGHQSLQISDATADSFFQAPSFICTSPVAGGLQFTDGTDTVSFSVGITAGGSEIRFEAPPVGVAPFVLYQSVGQDCTLGYAQLSRVDITNTSGLPDLRILGSGLPTNLSEIYLAQDTWPSAGSETEFRIIAAGSSYGGLYANGLIFRGLANGVIYDRMMMQVSPTSRTTYMAAPVGINVAASSTVTLNLSSSGTNTTVATAAAAGGFALYSAGRTVIAPSGGVPNSYFPGNGLTSLLNNSSTWIQNGDNLDAPGHSFQNNNSSTAAGQFSGIRFTGSRGAGGTDRTLYDLHVVRNTASTGEGVMYFSGRDTNIGGYTFRTALAAGNPFCWLAPNTSTGWVGMLTQAAPSAGYKFAVGPAATTATHSEFNGNVLIRGNAQVSGSLTYGGALTVTDFNATGNVTLGDANTDTLTINGDATCTYKMTVTGTFSTLGDSVLGNAPTDTVTCASKLSLPSTTYLVAGTQGIVGTNGGAAPSFTTRTWQASGGTSKTSAAAATQQVRITWRATYTAPAAGRKRCISGVDVIGCTRWVGDHTGTTTMRWSMPIDSAFAPGGFAISASTGINGSGSTVSATAIAFNLVSGTTYDLVITYTLNNIVTTSDMDIAVDSTYTSPQAFMTGDPSAFSVVSLL